MNLKEKRPEEDEESSLHLSPIGFIRTAMRNKFDAPHQPERGQEDRSIIELLPQQGFETALEDLAGFAHIWLLFWFHRNTTWRPKVQPPRGEAKKRGVFATRSPHRPNPIGMSVVPLIEISKCKITIGSCDLLDGTPILDIKPYIPAIDSIPHSRIGWLQDVENSLTEAPSYTVTLSEVAAEQSKWLHSQGIDFLSRAVKILERDPSPNRTRRIRRFGAATPGAGLFRMGCAEWRIFFSLDSHRVTIQYFRPGYPPKQLLSPGSEKIVNRDAQLEFLARYPH